MENTYHILVVDDDRYITDVLKNVLEDEGFRVTAVNDGQVAIAIYRECQADLIILDIKMPGMDGYEVLEHIREESDIPVIVLTGSHEIESVVKMLGLGANDYVVKPFRDRELIARVQAKIRRANLYKS
jgi:DNA-binding response OmpR family regulator